MLLALAGIAVFNVSPFFDWFSDANSDATATGYEADSLIPFIAYLGAGLAVAMIYAAGRAERRQHRGLTLVTMAVGIAALAQVVATIIDAPGIPDGAIDSNTDIGVWIALIGAALWALGAAIQAADVEGDPEPDLRVTERATTRTTTDHDATAEPSTATGGTASAGSLHTGGAAGSGAVGHTTPGAAESTGPGRTTPGANEGAGAGRPMPGAADGR